MLLRTSAARAIALAFCTASSAAHAQRPERPGPAEAALVPGRYLVTYRNGAIPGNAESRAAHAGTRLVSRHERLGIVVVEASATESPVAAAATRVRLAQDAAVESVVQDRIVSAHLLTVAAAPTAPGVTALQADLLYYSPQGWAVRQAGGYGPTTAQPAVRGPWSVTRGAHVRIAILDSGIDATHPDLAPNLALNLSEVNQKQLASACDDGTPQDQEGHGTWTASLAAGALGPQTGQVAGVAPEATLLNIKVLQRMPSAAGDCASGQASGLLSWLIQGIEDAVQNRADIVSMSLGALVNITTGDGAGLKATFDHVTHAAAAAGVLLIAAAGNEGFNLADQRYVELPAQARDVLAIVASTNPDCTQKLTAGATCVPGPVTLAYYSNYGAPLNALAAPGGSYPPGASLSNVKLPAGRIAGACSISGCFNLGHAAYVQAIGTSASAPLAAGAAALVLGAHPAWSASQVVAALRGTASHVATLPVGLVNPAALVVAAPPSQSPAAPPKR